MKVVKVMKKNDDAIQKLFDDYAEDLVERPDLAERAKAALVAQNAADAEKAQKQRKPNVWNWLAPVCAVLLVFVVSFSVLGRLGILQRGDSEDDNISEGNQHATSPDSPYMQYYSSSEVKGRRISLSDCDETLRISQIKAESEYQVVSERYYAFYFSDGTLAYVKAVIGVRTEAGLCEITIIAETDGLLRNDLRETYERNIGGRTADIMITLPDGTGEFVTNAYFSARGAHFYVYAMTGASSTLAEEILSKIL